MAPLGRPVLIYDGDCAFCTSSVRLIERRLRVPADMVPFQSADLAVLGTTVAQASREVVWVRSDGRTYGGAQAVAMLLIAADGGWRPVGVLLRIPPFRWLAQGIYRLIARFRHRLPGGTAACALPTVAPREGGDLSAGNAGRDGEGGKAVTSNGRDGGDESDLPPRPGPG